MKDKTLKHAQSGRAPSGQIITGAIIVLVGVLLLVGQFVDVGNIFRFFPLVFIGLAGWQLVQNGRQHATGPLITIAIFGFLQLAMLDLIDGEIIGRLWPLVLIFIGASILLRQRNGGEDVFGTTDQQKSNDDRFDLFAMFGGGSRLMTSQNFQGGNATVLFGGAEIDLYSAQVENKPAIISAFAMFGGIEVKASDDMLIKNESFALFGGTSDERTQRKMLSGESADVIVRGTVLFGGISITN